MKPSELYCHEVQPRVAEYHQGKLSEEMAIRIQQHLAHCVTCRSYFQQWLEAAETQTVSLLFRWIGCDCHRCERIASPAARFSLPCGDILEST